MPARRRSNVASELKKQPAQRSLSDIDFRWGESDEMEFVVTH